MRSARAALRQSVAFGFRLRSTKSPVLLPGPLLLPTLTLTLFPPRSAHGVAQLSLPTGWQMGGRSRIGKLVSCFSSHGASIVFPQSLMLPLSVFHDCWWPQLETGNRCPCTRQLNHGRCNHNQRENRCQSEYSDDLPTLMVQLTLSSSILHFRSSLVCHSDTTPATSW